MPSGPIAGTKITEEYATLVGRDVYLWAWPLVNLYNRRLTYEKVPEIVMAGPVPAAPLNRLGMLTNYIVPEERIVACPNQDVVYGAGALALDLSPAVIQVPDFGDRFWVYQVVDLRTDSFAELGKMYGTTPGFYLLVGPNWKGEVPKGISRAFRSSTNTGYVIPRVFQDDDPEDNKAVQNVTQMVMMYPLAEFDGTMKSRDWTKLPQAPTAQSGEEEVKWVVPETFFGVLPRALADAPPLPGEESRYAQVQAVLAAAETDPKIKAALTKAAIDADNELVKPLFEFRNWGLQLPHYWSTQSNGASFGTDYFTRAAAAKANIFVNKPNETKYFYQDLDSTGQRLNGANRYTITFLKGQTPPVNGFWSLTMYNQHHFFEPNEIKRYSVGTKNKSLKPNPDGSLTIYVQADAPTEAERAYWLPAPKGRDFSLYLRSYWPKVEIADGSWTPPAVIRPKMSMKRRQRCRSRNTNPARLSPASLAEPSMCRSRRGLHPIVHGRARPTCYSSSSTTPASAISAAMAARSRRPIWTRSPLTDCATTICIRRRCVLRHALVLLRGAIITRMACPALPKVRRAIPGVTATSHSKMG
jgi:hypothetical protein